MENPVIDLSELLKMFGIYRRRLNSGDPVQQELYDALIELDKSVLNKIRQLRELYWNVLQKQTLTHRHKANKIIKAAEEWKESFPEENPQPIDLYEEFTVELSRSKDLPPWGISIIGGEEDQDGPGIYINEVYDNSIAQSSGALMPFDRIVEVNSNDTRIVKHDVANELLRVRNETLVIKISRKMDIYPKEQESQIDILDVYLQTDNPIKGFGITIKGGKDDRLIDDHDGIFITHVSGVAAENTQLHKGDRIISANNTNLEHVYREEAIQTIRSCPHLLHLKVQKRALLHIAQPGLASCIREVFLRSIDGIYGLSLGGSDGKIYVTRLTPGGAGEKNGHIFIGDQLIAVGDHSITRNCTVDQALKFLQNYPQQVNLKLVHAQREFNSLVNARRISDCMSHSSTRESMVTESLYFKIHFDYNPLQDKE
ncbi:PSD-95 alpha [Oopsacas minuta]|uniref:PSD-95 alpha n=1 Tax=Oopsacas minuta TaxID=111878 RepID=A0AAV7JPP2_9METZ|nr:PSD-95 alpha [Oopsacas minuta]